VSLALIKMKCSAILLALLASASARDSPVSKVTNLLEDLKVKIEKDADADEEDYKKHDCWCKKVQSEKAEMIESETAQIAALRDEIEVGKAEDAVVDNEVEKLEEEEGENKGSQEAGLATAAARKKANTDEMKEQNSTMSAITNAAKLLGGESTTGAPSFLQFAAVQRTVTHYEPQAASIAGLLEDQLKTTEEDYEGTSKAEQKAATSFKSWIGNMQEDLGIIKEEEAEKKGKDADLEVEIAEDSEEAEATEEQKKADMAFLQEAEASCLKSKTEYTTRVELRSKELGGVNKALEILDTNRELLRKTTKSFLQISSNSSGGSFSDAQQKVAVALQNVFAELKSRARKSHSLRMAVLAGEVHDAMPDGAFTTVLSKIDGMMAKLKAEAAHDVEKKDNCTTDLFSMKKKTKNVAFLVQKSTAQIAQLEMRISTLQDEKAEAVAEISKANETLAAALTLRTEQNTVFHQEKEDDQAAIKVLEETRAALAKYYEKEDKAADSLVQVVDPNKLSDKRKKLQNEEHKYTLSGDKEMAATGTLAVIDRIIENLHKEIEEDKKDEASSQVEYEEQKALMETSREKLMKKVTTLGSAISNHGGSKVDEETDLKINEDEQTSLANLKESKENECHDLLTNFDEIVSKRESEMDGLARGKELLSGASPTLVQQSSSVSTASSDDKETLMNYLGLDQ